MALGACITTFVNDKISYDESQQMLKASENKNVFNCRLNSHYELMLYYCKAPIYIV